jgi:predicted ATP-grasp superfamily ATP-dependent carboligase
MARTVGALGLLGAALPLNLAVTGAALVRSALGQGPHRPTNPPNKTILVSGGKMTKALQLARSFHAAGHRVVLVETARYRLTGHRFSRAVDRFHVVPDATDPGYAAALLRIVQREGVDVYVPVCSPVASRHDAQAAELLADHCEVVHVPADDIDELDDKYRFARAAETLGLGVPRTHLITDPQQVLEHEFPDDGSRWILKSIPYDPVRRLDLTPLPRPTHAETRAFVEQLPISPEQPWILQELVEGREYCTHGLVRDGRLQVWACCESSPFQVNYEMVDKPEIEAWVRRFVEAQGLTGQVSFDFMETPDGELKAIECNPRTHSAVTMFHGHPDLARAYLEDGVPTITPLPDSRPTYWLYQEVWRLLSRPSSAAVRLRVVLFGRDATFAWDDPLPFLLVPHLQIPSLLFANLLAGRDWVRIDFNIGKLVEPAGD